jgi:hypothetical protein
VLLLLFLRNDIHLFFKDFAMLTAIVEKFFKKSYRVSHWHNNWKTVHDIGFPLQSATSVIEQGSGAIF